jgi:hypothetical protein
MLLFLPLVYGIVTTCRTSRDSVLRQVLIALAAFMLVVVPWTYRNYAVFGKCIPVSANGGLNIAIGNNPSGPSSHNSYIDSVWSDSTNLEQVGGLHWTEAQRDSFFLVYGLEYIREHPGDFLKRGAGKLAVTFGADNFTFAQMKIYTNATAIVFGVSRGTSLPPLLVSITAALVSTLLTLLLLLNGVWYYLLVGFSVYVLGFRKSILSTGIRWPLLLSVGAVAGMVVLTFGLSRYKEPLELFFMMSLAVESALWVRSRRRSE